MEFEVQIPSFFVQKIECKINTSDVLNKKKGDVRGDNSPDGAVWLLCQSCMKAGLMGSGLL